MLTSIIYLFEENVLLKLIFIIFFCFNPIFPKTFAETASFLEAKNSLKDYRSWTYPYPEIIDYLTDKDEETFLIFSYGSLMDKTSAEQTLGRKSMDTRKMAVAYNIKRVFDRDVEIKPNSKWGIPLDPEARGMLNVIPSDSGSDLTNGVLIEVSREDMAKVLLREEGYDLIPVIVQEWENFIHNKPVYKVAYTFYAPQNSSYTSSSILPRPSYYELTRDAAYNFGPLFYLLWLKTTYMADGITSIEDWEKEVRENSPSTLKTASFINQESFLEGPKGVCR